MQPIYDPTNHNPPGNDRTFFLEQTSQAAMFDSNISNFSFPTQYVILEPPKHVNSLASDYL